jgi:nucleoside-diphosphate-sugar epimerase
LHLDIKRYNIHKMNIALTGASGSLGLRICHLYINSSKYLEEYSLICLVRNKKKFESSYPHLLNKITLIEGDLNNHEALSNLIQNADICIHAAAELSPIDKKKCFETNYIGTKNIVKHICANEKKTKLIFCSTLSTLSKFIIKNEYSKTKILAEKYILDNINNNKISGHIINIALMYGEHEKHFVPTLIQAIQKRLQKPLILLSGGEKDCPIIHIDDLCEMLFELIENQECNHNQMIAMGNQHYGMHDVLRFFYDKMNGNPKSVYFPSMPIKIICTFVEVLFNFLNKVLQSNRKLLMTRRNVDVAILNRKDFRGYVAMPYSKDQIDLMQGLEKAYLYHIVT